MAPAVPGTPVFVGEIAGAVARVDLAAYADETATIGRPRRDGAGLLLTGAKMIGDSHRIDPISLQRRGEAHAPGLLPVPETRKPQGGAIRTRKGCVETHLTLIERVVVVRIQLDGQLDKRVGLRTRIGDMDREDSRTIDCRGTRLPDRGGRGGERGVRWRRLGRARCEQGESTRYECRSRRSHTVFERDLAGPGSTRRA